MGRKIGGYELFRLPRLRILPTTAGAALFSVPLGREVFTKTGTVVPVQTLMQVNHCEKLPFKTVAKNLCLLISTVVS